MLEPESCAVTFLPSGRTINARPGELLIKCARRAGVHVNASCGGAGVCGKCRVQVEEGEVSGGKSEKITEDEFAAGWRQACTAKVAGSIRVRVPVTSELGAGALSTEVPSRHRAHMHVFDLQSLRKEGIFIPPVEKLFLELPRPSTLDNMADAGRLVHGLSCQYQERHLVLALPVLRKLRRTLREDDFRVTATIARVVGERGRPAVVNIQAGNWAHRSFGLAFDLGTTTVHGHLLDLNSGKILASQGDYNAQISYGEDVISRIVHAEKPKGLELMHDLLVGTINGLIGKILDKAGVSKDEINSITLAGNTTITHFLLELEPNSIRRAPYTPVSTFFPPFRATDLGLDLNSFTVALVYPSISSYVGGDIVAGVMGSGLYRSEAVTLYIDIGTNAEIVIGNRDWMACAACSAGPAFEGGGITHGMRAAPGAIEDFDLDPVTLEPMSLTVGGKRAIGICGSGLLIAVATMLEHGVLGPDGKFNRALQSPRLRDGRNGREFVLVWKEDAGGDSDIVLNEVDIDNFMRTKAAIYAGVKTLVEAVGLRITDLEQIILAGAFGSYIDIDSAMTVGLLPEVDPERILYIGNGSLLGCWMSAISNHIRKDVVQVVRRMTSFELSEVPAFKDQYVASLFLPHTDRGLFPKVASRLAGKVGHKIERDRPGISR